MLEQVDKIKEQGTEIQKYEEALRQAGSLEEMEYSAWEWSRYEAARKMEEELTKRGRQKGEVECCSKCSSKKESKGLVDRGLLTLVGVVNWKRRVYRCPQRCEGQHVAPLDRSLGLEPYQEVSSGVQRLGCMLSMFVSYALSAYLLGALTGLQVSAQTLWNWVQEAGERAMQKLTGEMEKYVANAESIIGDQPEALSELFAIGADAVSVPFRPHGGSPHGKTQWQQVKVGVTVWLKKKLTTSGKQVLRTVERHVVAVLGSVEEFELQLSRTALESGVLAAEQVVWLSDGGPWLWGIFGRSFSRIATGVLDFYHATQYLWKGCKVWLDGRTQKARTWFASARHRLREGEVDSILEELQQALQQQELPEEAREVLTNLYEYLKEHREHMDYPRFEEAGLPLGSGLIESTCKWLIQQRFKGVGMRWSEQGFQHLLHLRLAFYNRTFDTLFCPKLYPPEQPQQQFLQNLP